MCDRVAVANRENSLVAESAGPACNSLLCASIEVLFRALEMLASIPGPCELAGPDAFMSSSYRKP